ncbi:MAG: helix-hairpin-helix domain-containing protein [Faecalibacterium prausnitzii]
MRELIAYLAQFEISPRRAMEVFRTFGPGAMQAIQQNPYLLCGEPLQLDFRHADSIAQYYQMAGDCAQRLEAALLRTLRHNAGNGHTCLPRAQLLETASNFIHQPPKSWRRRWTAASRPGNWRCGCSTEHRIFICRICWLQSRTSPTVWPC